MNERELYEYLRTHLRLRLKEVSRERSDGLAYRKIDIELRLATGKVEELIDFVSFDIDG